MATGGIEEGNPPFEAGASQRDMDYLHIIDLKKAVAAFEAGKGQQVNGFPVIPLQTSIDDGILHLVPEPKSPHGVDVTPRGDYIVVSGKLDPHVTVYSFEKIQEAIASKKSTPDEYGVPILDFDAVKEAQVEVGLGPLHTQFDDKGYAYTSLFLDTAVARWTLATALPRRRLDAGQQGDRPLQHRPPLGRRGRHGHARRPVPASRSTSGRSIASSRRGRCSRRTSSSSTSRTGEPMQLLYDMPMGIGEPHYAQIIKADKLKPWKVYPEVGWDPAQAGGRSRRAQGGGGEGRPERQQRRGLHDGRPEPLHARSTSSSRRAIT